MPTVIWAVLAAAALLLPSRLAGPLDGAPLDQPAEAVVFGLLAAWLLAAHASFLRHNAARALVVALLAWKAATGAALTQDGWCVRFTSEAPIYEDAVTVPHSWDVRADWRAAVPRCSAVMTAAYPAFERFPAWFLNLAPADPLRQATPADRPPEITTAIDVSGFLLAAEPGVLRVTASDDVRVVTRVDDWPLETADLARGVGIEAGAHRVSIAGVLVNERWSLSATWDGADPWRGGIATLAPPSAVDRWVRPWGRFVTPLLAIALLVVGVGTALRRIGVGVVFATSVALSVVMAGLALTGREPVVRAASVLLLATAAVALPRRLRNTVGASWLLGVPLLALVAVVAWPRVGAFTLYSSGDDWWMFQRFGYRIFLQGHWLEAGEPTFWFQPFYRYIAGALHMAFGDSSVGELFWDAGCAVVGALFAFHVTKAASGARWGLAAGAVTLAVYLLGPAWYLFGRGLSEISSMGFLYAAALLALRARHGYWPAAAAAGVLAALAFYARLNNLPMALGVALFALPLRQPAGDWWRPRQWAHRVSRPALAGVTIGVALALWLFTARTYYFTGIPSMLHGTQAGLLSNWRPGAVFVDNVSNIAGSLLMVLTMNDPPRFDARAIPVMAGAIAAVGALAGAPILKRLPFNVAAFCLTGLSGALVARGSAYPGRFTVHLVPVAVALCVSAVALATARRVSRPAGGGAP